MQIASILSDLTSLRACDPTAALTLVTARPSPPSSSVDAVRQQTAEIDAKRAEKEDTDLQRAKDVVDLHYGVKVKYERSGGAVDHELMGLREELARLVGGMGR